MKRLAHIPLLYPTLRWANGYLPTWIARRAHSFFRRPIYTDERAQYFDTAFALVNEKGIDGDYLEFGVYKGTTFKLAYETGQKYGFGGRYIGFDGFQGLPHSEGPHTKGDLVWSKDHLLKEMRRVGIDLGRVEVVEGMYKDTLVPSLKARLQLKQAAIVHIDCDLYESTRRALEFVQDIVQPNCVILFDDWSDFDELVGPEEAKNYGEQRAFNEWPQRNNFEPIAQSPRGMAFVMVQTNTLPAESAY